MELSKGSQTKLRILESAEKLVLGNSFNSIGISEILKASGVPKGSFYYYFSSKEEFGVELIGYAEKKYGTILDELLFDGSLDARSRLMSFLKFHISFYESNSFELTCLIIKLSTELSSSSEPLRRALDNASDNWVSKFQKILEEGQGDGSINSNINSKSFANFLYSSWIGSNTQVVVTKSVEPFRALIKVIDSLT